MRDVLKVGHHGSAYGSSPAFIAAVRPRYAVISVGRHNLFGHPAPSTIDTLRRFGVRIYRTDEDGAVSIVSDGMGDSIATQLGGDETREADQPDVTHHEENCDLRPIASPCYEETIPWKVLCCAY